MRRPDRPDPTYLALRARLLATTPETLGLVPTERLPRVWAVLADLRAGGGIVTVVTVADGTTSLYTSRGGGIIGAGTRPAVAAASARLLEACEAGLDRIPAVSEAALPPRGRVAWTVLTRAGMRRLTAREPSPADGQELALTLFLATHDVIAALREAQPEVTRR
jgi:hypothetical protein